MTAVFQSIQNRSFIPFMPSSKQGLPVSQTDHDQGRAQRLRRRLSSLSLNLNLKIQPPSSFPSPAAAFRRCQSVPDSLGSSSSIRKWWEWGWGWILSRKPTFARDLEMNEEETAVLGRHNKGSWRHVFYKVRSELRKLMGGADKVGLPRTFRYDSLDYSKNFDHGNH